MKRIFPMQYILVAMMSLLLSATKVNAQLTPASVQQLIENKQFIFIADWADPFRGRMRQLTPSYDFTVKGDSIISFLPYFGVSRMAPISSSEAGIQFTTTDFTYVAVPGKKQRWEITIDVKDQRNSNRFVIDVYKDGTARMNVTSTFRDPINFRGYIKGIK